MNIEIINIGDELLLGQVVNTNATFMSKELINYGFNVSHIVAIADDKKEIEDALLLSLKRSDGVIITGGLGPTKDDITKETLARVLNIPLVEDVETLQMVRDYFNKRGLPLTDTNRQQALLPKDCIVIKNNYGTAAGMCISTSEKKLIISLPGVPFEMKAMFPEVISLLKTHYKTGIILQKTLLIAGIGESFLSDMIADFEDNLPQEIKLAYLPNAGTIRLRLTAKGNDEQELKDTFESNLALLLEKVKDYFIGFEQNISAILFKHFTDNNQTLATAESCTGGNIAHLITLNTGASSIYKGGIVAYSNEVKERVLNVKTNTLKHFGAVSEQVVIEMVQGVCKLLHTDYAIATTGIAGPTGGSEEKPVGTIWIAVCDKAGNTKTKKCFIPTTRDNFIERASNEAILLLLSFLHYKL
ncbi:MAG: competence/damage-inducible protein A [Bacteroidales bacterium]|jgi:nicotinamide-nucleotide amidase|nr:competence/damage-inducible protein A [Bacteroidales bacterium]